MKFDDVIEKTGAFGRFQLITFLLIGGFGFWTYHGVAAPFVVFPLEHWCKIPALANLSYEQQRYVGIPKDEESEDGEYEKCKR